MQAVTQSVQSLTERVQGIVDEVLRDTSYYLVELNVRGTRGSQVVEVYVDGDDGVGVDDLAEISREIGFVLDVEDVIEAKYNLNVSTPGLDRPLRLKRQYTKNIGRPLQVHYRKADGSGNTEVQGELRTVSDETIEIATTDEATTSIPFESILWAKVKLPW